jgi:hypothetical protein
VDLRPADGGWCGVLRLARVRSETELVLGLAEGHRVRVQPGFFYDFSAPGYLVLSLLPAPAVFAEGLSRLSAGIAELLAEG